MCLKFSFSRIPTTLYIPALLIDPKLPMLQSISNQMPLYLVFCSETSDTHTPQFSLKECSLAYPKFNLHPKLVFTLNF